MFNRAFVFIGLLTALGLSAQVYSPKLMREGQPDATDMKKFAEAICRQAKAHSQRERAEAIWRFFLTDGRFVKPGFWYHIAGWAYEEPSGEVLDPIKLLNSYGFGLCYHIAPLLEAVFQAAGFQDARCWFLTGHTVTEVFYDGSYHYFDSDMMGYNVAGDGAPKGKPVASVRDLERHPEIILGKLAAADREKPGAVDSPWYPADVRARAMPDLANLFTTSNDNYLYPYTRHADGHTMDFQLRPGETLTRFFKPEQPDLYYLPYRFDGQAWKEFPQEIAEYQIQTKDGPRSQKDNRLWATGRFDYSVAKVTDAVTVIPMLSPYVIIDAQFKMNANVPAGANLAVETSTDNGQTWRMAGQLTAAHRDEWTCEPEVIVKSAHGQLTAVSGSYGYQVRISKSAEVQISSVQLRSRVQLNPRSLPFLEQGRNEFTYNSGDRIKREEVGDLFSKGKLTSMERVEEKGQTLLRPTSLDGDAVYELGSADSGLTGFDVGARFLDLRDGLAPDKLTAETRHTAVTTTPGQASISWSRSLDGPFEQLWRYNPSLNFLDGDTVERLLRWPQAFKQVRNLPAGTRKVFIKLSSGGPAIDDIRMATYSEGSGAGGLKITQVWDDGGQSRQHEEWIKAGQTAHKYSIEAGKNVENKAVIFAAR